MKHSRGRFLDACACIASGQTAAAPYSLLARPFSPVATPIEWDELSTATPDKYTLRSIPRRLARKADPWQDIREHARTLS